MPYSEGHRDPEIQIQFCCSCIVGELSMHDQPSGDSCLSGSMVPEFN